MLNFEMSAVSVDKPLYANGVKEYKIKITENIPDVIYTSIKFNVISIPPQGSMALKGTFDSGSDVYLGSIGDITDEITVDISIAQPPPFDGHSIPLVIELGSDQLDDLKNNREVNLLIELVAGVGLGTTVPAPSGGFSADPVNPHLRLKINQIQAEVEVNEHPMDVAVLLQAVPP